ncbi:MAG: hypothetical protein ABUS51_04220 [Acidobacteriota bacterium]
MPFFPTLKTGAAAQYPLERSVCFATQSVRFLDGSTQRYPLRGAGLRRWTVRLDLLDDQELAAVIDFVEQQGSGTFSFVDPVTGDTASQCIVAGETFDSIAESEMTGQARLVIQEIL